MKKPRIYVDTSVIGGCFDVEFRERSLALVEDFRRDGSVPVVSDVTAAEVALALATIGEVDVLHSPREVISHGQEDRVSCRRVRSQAPGPASPRAERQVAAGDPTKRWKLSPRDVESRNRWQDCSRAKDYMLVHTDIGQARWYVVNSDNRKRAHLNCIAHLLSLFPYRDVTPKKMKPPGNWRSSPSANP